MQKIRNKLSAVMLSLMFIGIATDCSADYNIILENGYRHDRFDLHIEALDRHQFKDTRYTSVWKATKDVSIYQLGALVQLLDEDCTHIFARLHGRHGWILNGTSVGSPLHWKIDGYTNDISLKLGYIINVYDCFRFIPNIGYAYDEINIKLKDQPNCLNTFGPVAFADRNGDRSKAQSYAPFVGFDIRFNNCFCDAYDVNFLVGYDFHYGNGRLKLSVRDFFLTDDTNTSHYGYTVKFRDLTTHSFRIAGGTTFCDNWIVGLDFEYVMQYNTHSNRLHLEHNDAIVATGQFTPSQYHVVNHAFYYSYVINLDLGYKF